MAISLSERTNETNYKHRVSLYPNVRKGWHTEKIMSPRHWNKDRKKGKWLDSNGILARANKRLLWFERSDSSSRAVVVAGHWHLAIFLMKHSPGWSSLLLLNSTGCMYGVHTSDAVWTTVRNKQLLSAVLAILCAIKIIMVYLIPWSEPMKLYVYQETIYDLPHCTLSTYDDILLPWSLLEINAAISFIILDRHSVSLLSQSGIPLLSELHGNQVFTFSNKHHLHHGSRVKLPATSFAAPHHTYTSRKQAAEPTAWCSRVYWWVEGDTGAVELRFAWGWVVNKHRHSKSWMTQR